MHIYCSTPALQTVQQVGSLKSDISWWYQVKTRREMLWVNRKIRGRGRKFYLFWQLSGGILWREPMEVVPWAMEVVPGKVQPSPMTSLHSPTPISAASSFLTWKRRKEEDPSLVLLMKQNSPSSPCPTLWMKREDKPTTSPPLGLPGRVRRHCWHGFHCLTLGT